MPLPDYHIHTARCGHATGSMKEYVEHALARGLKEIGFADHIPMYWLDENRRDPELAMPDAELPRYVEEVEKLRSSYRGINIRLGIEADYIPGCEEQLQRIIQRYPFDYVLGSIHYVNGWGFDNPAYIHRYRETDLDQLYRDYFLLLQQAAQSRLFDIMAHPDLVKKFGFRPRGDLRRLYLETAKAVVRAGVCLEVNTAGLRTPAGEIYPAPDFLHMCKKFAVPVTTGSDAHKPDQVGFGFDRATEMLTGAGYDKVTHIKARQTTQIFF